MRRTRFVATAVIMMTMPIDPSSPAALPATGPATHPAAAATPWDAVENWRVPSPNGVDAVAASMLAVPGDRTEAAKITLCVGLSRFRRLLAVPGDRQHLRQDDDVAVLPPNAPSAPGLYGVTLLLVRTDGGWHVLPPFGDPLVSSTAMALPADQRARLAKLIAAGGDIRPKGAVVQDELMLAVAADDAAGADDCLRRGATWSGQSIYGGSPLEAALMCDRPMMVRRVMESGYDLSVERTPPLIDAIEAGCTDAALALIAYRRDLDRPGRIGKTAVLAALERGSVSTVQALLAAGAAFDPQGHAGDYITAAASSGQWPAVAFVREHCGDLKGLSRIGYNALQALSRGSDLATVPPDAARIVDALLEAGVDPHFAGKRAYAPFAPLAAAAMNPRRVTVVRALLARVTYSPAELDTAMDSAGKTGAVEALGLLARARIAAGGPPPAADLLVNAAGHYDAADAVGRLLALGMPVDTPAKKLLRTPLQAAVTRGDGETVTVLLSHGADPALLDDCGENLLTLANTRLAKGRETVSDSPIPNYEPERDGHADAGQSVLVALQTWLRDHPDAWSRLKAAADAAMRTPVTPSADPAAAIAAFDAASRRQDRAALTRLVLLPDEPIRRSGVLRRLKLMSESPPMDRPMRLIKTEWFDSVAVAHVVVRGVMASSRRQEYFDVPAIAVLARRSGGWLYVIDPTEAGGLTAAEVRAIGPTLRAAAAESAAESR